MFNVKIGDRHFSAGRDLTMSEIEKALATSFEGKIEITNFTPEEMESHNKLRAAMGYSPCT